MGYRQKGDMGTGADKLIQEICDWLDQNLSSEDYIECNIYVKGKDHISRLDMARNVTTKAGK